MMIKPALLPVLGAVTTAVLIGMNPVPAAEMNACKGLEQTQCVANDDCSYVKEHVRTNGVKVAGHCRYKPGRKKMATEQITTPPPPVNNPPAAAPAPAKTAPPPAPVMLDKK